MSALGFVKSLFGGKPDQDAEEKASGSSQAAEQKRKSREAEEARPSLSFVPNRHDDWGKVKGISRKK